MGVFVLRPPSAYADDVVMVPDILGAYVAEPDLQEHVRIAFDILVISFTRLHLGIHADDDEIE